MKLKCDVCKRKLAGPILSLGNQPLCDDLHSINSNIRINLHNLEDKYKSILQNEYSYYLSDQMMFKVDRASMANSLEVRSPLVDNKLIEYIFSHTTEYVGSNFQKLPLYKYLETDFDKSFLNRPKQGFEPPLGKWMRGPLKNWITDILLYDDGFLNKKKIETLFKLFLKGENKLTYKLWTIIMFKTWKLENYS